MFETPRECGCGRCAVLSAEAGRAWSEEEAERRGAGGVWSSRWRALVCTFALWRLEWGALVLLGTLWRLGARKSSARVWLRSISTAP